MPEFSPRQRAEAAKAKKQPDQKKNDPNKDGNKAAVLKQLQKMYGSKTSFEALMRGKFDVTKVAKEAAGPELMAKFIVPEGNLILKAGTQIFMDQLTSYSHFLGAYGDYVEQIRKYGAYGLFWKYQEAFKKFGIKLIKEVLMKNVDDLTQLIKDEVSDDNTRDDLIKTLSEVQAELRKRENGDDVVAINNRVSSQTDITKTKDGAQLEKTISAEVNLSTPPDDYIKTFLKNHDILMETFDKKVKDEVDKKREELTDKLIELPAEANAETTGSTANPTSMVASASDPSTNKNKS